MEKSARAQMQRSSLFFHGLVLFVAAISVHDAAMVVLNHQVMIDVEENPVGRWLIELNQGRVGLFVALKLAGTAVVCTSLKLIYERHPRIGLAVAVVLALIQAMLLVYLCVK